MHGHHDSDHYDVQFTTRQLVMLFGLLIVIVVGVFVGGIVIGRGMAPAAAEAMMAARRTSPGPAPPPAKAAPASVAEAPAEDALRLPIRSEPSPAARAAARAPARETTAPGTAPPPARTRPDSGFRAPARTASSSPEQLANRTLATPEPRAANPAPARAGRSAEAGRRREVHHPGRRFPRPRRCRADAGAARGRGIEGYLEGTPAGIFRVRVGQFESRRRPGRWRRGSRANSSRPWSRAVRSLRRPMRRRLLTNTGPQPTGLERRSPDRHAQRSALRTSQPHPEKTTPTSAQRPKAQAARRLGTPVFRPARAALRAAHGVTPPAKMAPTSAQRPKAQAARRLGPPASAGTRSAPRYARHNPTPKRRPPPRHNAPNRRQRSGLQPARTALRTAHVVTRTSRTRIPALPPAEHHS